MNLEYSLAKLKKAIVSPDGRRVSDGTIHGLCEEFKKQLNSRFGMTNQNRLFTCKEVIINTSEDKPFFGVIVYPHNAIGKKATYIDSLFEYNENEDWVVYYSAYTLELDIRLFMMDSPISETLAYIVNDITAIKNMDLKLNIGAMIDYLTTSVDIVKVKAHTQLFTHVLAVTARNLTSVFCKWVNADGERVYRDDMYATEAMYPGMLLQWFLNIYDKPNYDEYIIDILEKSLEIEGSICYANATKSLIKHYVNYNSIREGQLMVMAEAAGKKKKGLISQLKLNGLRSIEEDLYEYNMRLRNVSTQDEAILLMRQLNSRMSIIEDYLYRSSEELDDRERERWEKVYQGYVDIRDELSKKTVYDKKMYGLFVDYNALQGMSNNGQLMNTYY